MADAWRGRLVSVRRLGGDLRLDVEADHVHFRQVSDAHGETGPR
jgi:hypothetical protein